MMTHQFAHIEYRDFWDVPRMFLVRHDGHLYLFDCEFDEETEDFRNFYKVYIMPELSEEERSDAWIKLPNKATHFCGSVPTGSVLFDETKRNYIDTAILDSLAPELARLTDWKADADKPFAFMRLPGYLVCTYCSSSAEISGTYRRCPEIDGMRPKSFLASIASRITAVHPNDRPTDRATADGVWTNTKHARLEFANSLSSVTWLRNYSPEAAPRVPPQAEHRQCALPSRTIPCWAKHRDWFRQRGVGQVLGYYGHAGVLPPAQDMSQILRRLFSMSLNKHRTLKAPAG
jgi:hypothetical protein